MKVLVITPLLVLQGAGDSDIHEALNQKVFSGTSHENVSPEWPAVESPHYVHQKYVQAIEDCDAIIAICDQPSFAVGMYIERALSKKKLVSALVPGHLRGSHVDTEISLFIDGRHGPMTRDYFAWHGDGIGSIVEEVRKAITALEPLFGKERIAAA